MRRTTAAALLAGTAVALLASCAAPGGPGDDPTAASSAPAETAVTAPAPSETLVVQTPTLSPTAEATDTPSLAPATPVASAVWNAKLQELDVAGIVPGTVETGGTCTATATRGDAVLTVTAPASAASSYTGCQALVLKGAALTAGTWQVRVDYRSAQSQGASAAVPVTVG